MITVSNLAIQFGKRVLYNDVNMKFTNGKISIHSIELISVVTMHVIGLLIKKIRMWMVATVK